MAPEWTREAGEQWGAFLSNAGAVQVVVGQEPSRAQQALSSAYSFTTEALLWTYK